jgi:hypothetical protein
MSNTPSSPLASVLFPSLCVFCVNKAEQNSAQITNAPLTNNYKMLACTLNS